MSESISWDSVCITITHDDSEDGTPPAFLEFNIPLGQDDCFECSEHFKPLSSCRLWAGLAVIL
jgi:hypothetical protein